MQQNGILINPTEINHKKTEKKILNLDCSNITEYHNISAQKLGYKDWNEQQREDRWNKGISFPMTENKDCSKYFGIHIAEKHVSSLFTNPIRMPHDNPGFDWICAKGQKIQHKARCLYDSTKWNFRIGYNNIADYFMLSGWNNREDLEPIYLWLFHKDDIVRERKFWQRESFQIINIPKYLSQFRMFEISDKLKELKDICKGLNTE